MCVCGRGKRGAQALLQDPELRGLLIQAGLVVPNDELAPEKPDEDIESQTLGYARHLATNTE